MSTMKPPPPCAAASAFLLLLLSSSSPLAVRAYLGSLVELQWNTGCGQTSSGIVLDHCAELVFCHNPDNDAFGYLLPSDDPIADCGKVAPLLRMEGGKKYRLLLRNDAATEQANIHTHGLHISGEGNADDITRRAEPGECLAYHWYIPADHMGGTFWYHAHVHERTKDHVDGGAVGMLVIDDPTSFITNNPDINNDMAVQTWLDDDHEILLLAAHLGNSLYGNGVESDGDAFGDTIPIHADEWYRLRIALADPSAAPQTLKIVPVDESHVCDVHAAAHDGVWRFAVPKAQSVPSYELSGASRIDLAVRCQGSAYVTFGGDNNAVALLQTYMGQQPPAGLGVASPWKGGVSGATWGTSAVRPRYLEDLRAAAPEEFFTVQVNAGGINKENWNKDVPIGIRQYDKVQEWTVTGSANHPLHLHVYHMQIIGEADDSGGSDGGGCGGVLEEGEYFDTVFSGADCVVRFRTADVGGRVVMHCHVLQHEDGGAMGWVDVAGGHPAPGTDEVGSMTCPSTGPPGPGPGPAPTPPTAPATDAPAAAPNTCGGEDAPCSDDSDCCSGNCKSGNGHCNAPKL